MSHINKLIDELDLVIEEPKLGLPEEVFLFASRITPMVNVDLLIRNTNNEILLTWRGGDYYSPGWHVPGGIVRFKESVYERINKVAKIELGTSVEFETSPIMVNEIIRSPNRANRGHFISLLFDCKLKNSPSKQKGYGELKWFGKCPIDIIPVHSMYRDIINGRKSKEEYVSDFGISRTIFDYNSI